MQELIAECYAQSLRVLQENSSPFGVLACQKSKVAKERNYLSVFGRDAGICALGMAASGDPALIKTAEAGLSYLAQHQAQNGQIPNFVNPDRTDFWHLGCIDATLWWLLALKAVDARSTTALASRFKSNITAALAWLKCQEHPEDGLLVQNEASDWADIMPRTGKVLYTNALWQGVKTAYQLSGSELTRQSFNTLFYPFGGKKTKAACQKSTVSLIRAEVPATGYYLSYVNYLFWGADLDVLGNSLGIYFNLPEPSLRKHIVQKILLQKRAAELPMPVLFNPIRKNSREWRRYMDNHRQNLPFQYHNGGIWPFASCFWAMALAKAGFKEEAWQELYRVAAANRQGNWAFREWFQAKSGAGMGMRGQSWNAGAFLLACKELGIGGRDWGMGIRD